MPWETALGTTCGRTPFFKALLEADGPELDRVLADDFLLIDVLSGSEFQKPTCLRPCILPGQV